MEELGFKLNVNGDGLASTDKSVKSLKQQLKEARAEAAELAAKFGDTSKQASEAARRAAAIADTIGDTNARINAFNPDEKFRAVSQSLQGVASGFTAIQGVQGLLGANSADLEKQLLKVQAAMALSEGLNGLLAAKDSFNNLISVIKNTTVVQRILNATTSGFGKALAAAGIGIFIAALGYVVANFDSIKASITKAIPQLNNIGSVFNKVKEIAYGVGNAIIQYIATPISALVKVLQGDFKGAVNAVKDGLNIVKNYESGANVARQGAAEEAAKKRLDTLIVEKEKAIEIAKARGQDTYKLERETLQLQLKAAKGNAADQAKLNQEIRVLDASHQKELSDKRKQAQDKINSEEQKRREEEREKHEESLREANEIFDKYKEEAYQLTLSDQDRALRQIDVKHVEERKKLVENGKDLTQLNAVIEAEKLAVKKEFADKEKEEREAAQALVDKERKEKFDAEIEGIKQLETSKLLAVQQAQQQGAVTEAEARAQSLKLQEESLAAQVALTQQYGFNTQAVQNAALDASLKAQRAADDQKKADALAIEEAKYLIASSGVSALGSLTELALGTGKKAQAIQKGLGVVQIGIDTGMAISSMLRGVEAAAAAGGPAYPFIKIGLYAQGFASILANAAKAKKLLGGGGGGASVSGPSTNAPVSPKTPIENSATLLNRSGINNEGQSGYLKAIVVETDVTKVQNRIKQIETAAKF